MVKVYDLKYSCLYNKFWISGDNHSIEFCDVFQNIELFLEI